MHAKRILLGLFTPGLFWAAALPSAQAQTLTHDYELNGSYADALGGPSLVPNGGTLGPTGYTFPADGGPSLSGAVTPDNYTLDMVFSLDDVGGYRKIVDFKTLSSDSGLYNLSGNLDFFPIANGPVVAFTAGQEVRVVVTRSSATGLFTGYVNGVQEIQFTDTNGDATFTGAGAIINFLQDDTATGQREASSGFLDQVRVYSGPLSAAQVAALGGPAPEPSQGVALMAGAVCLGLRTLRARRRRAAG